MSFWLDWWMLMLLGMGIVIFVRILPKLGIKLSKDTFLPKILAVIVLAVFYLFSIGLFAGFTMNGPGGEPNGPVFLCRLNDWFFGIVKEIFPAYYAAHPNATSTEFMYSSAQEWLRNLAQINFDDLHGLAQSPIHLFAGVILFCLYPLWLYIGIRLGQILFGSKEGKKGIFLLMWPLVIAIFAILVLILAPLSL